MNTQLHLQTSLKFSSRGQLQRRDFLNAIAGTSAAAAGLTWADQMTASAADLRKQGKACILLWMQGGPSQFETFSPKPKHANGGETKAISTSVPGIEIAAGLPKTSQVMNDLCVIRSMNSREGAHPRATYLMHTGYLPTASVKYPTLGSIISHEIGDHVAELPSFVRIGGGRFGDSAGLLGVDYDPFVMQSAGRLPDNTALPTSSVRYQRRLNLLGKLEQDFATKGGQQEVADHQKVYDRAAKMILSPQMKAFDLDKESSATRKLYGESEFGKGCLLARRLVQAGVTFIEVSLGNWDTHFDNFEKTTSLCNQLDQPFAALIQDLKQQGMLDNTLVLWMGEFGRTPRINPRSGRDHFPKAFNMALAGGGVQGGQVIGRTNDSGDSVTDRPVNVNDMLRTVCTGLGVNPDKENMSNIGRPIKIVDGGKHVPGIFA
ncbi:hypothetical protein ETAA8_10160 [Anatilimnocola aggregata]|uniref:DUF1501 domain-containing protein n=1 Tax=Anatilimnocola aggregata TaxID=2528021 RepID=A0A517Y6S8_9BACT|nr:DUF1501 domain-containing protein [Anatilimnocola aggregata]QDU25944.1 hypothetical protein ETAA8_10160 [Anatilimnocola aggregata]